MWQKHLLWFWVRSSNCCSLTKCNSQGSVATLFRWGGKRLNYCTVNSFRTAGTKFHQNQLGFVEDMTKTFWYVFSVHRLDMAAAQTVSNNISARRTARNKIPMLTSIFSMSPGSTTLSPTQPEFALYRKYTVFHKKQPIF